MGGSRNLIFTVCPVAAEVRPAVEQANVLACTAQPDRPLQLLQRDAAPIKVLGDPFMGRREIASDARRRQQDALDFADVVLRFFLAGLLRPVPGEQATLAAFMVAKFSVNQQIREDPQDPLVLGQRGPFDPERSIENKSARLWSGCALLVRLVDGLLG